MLGPTGLDAFAAPSPTAVFDVGIAEQHAVTSAAGMAMAGLHPVVAVYATFLNRAFDQVRHGLSPLHRCGVTFVLDRAGVTGDDGASHNGMWDMSILQVVPGLRLAAPRDAATLRRAAARGIRGRRRADRRALPEGRGRPGPAGVGADRRRVTCSPGRARHDVLMVAVGSMARVRRRRRAAARRARHRGHGRRPSLGQAGRPGAGRAGPRVPAGRHGRGQRPRRWRRGRDRPGAARRRRDGAGPRLRHARSDSSTTPSGPRSSPRSG